MQIVAKEALFQRTFCPFLFYRNYFFDLKLAIEMSWILNRGLVEKSEIGT